MKKGLEIKDEDTKQLIIIARVDFMDKHKRLIAIIKTTKPVTTSDVKYSRNTSGPVPYGYKTVNGQYVIDKEQAGVIKSIFKMYLDGMTHTEIRNTLSSKGLMTKRNQPFQQTSIHSILRNEIYMGTVTKTVGDDTVTLKNAVPAIISETDFLLVRSLVESTKSQVHKAKEPYLLSGIAYCAECSGPLVGNRRKSKSGNIWSGYQCYNRKKHKTCIASEIKKEDVESEVLRVLEREVFSEDNINAMASEIYATYQKSLSNNSEQYAQVKQQLEDIENQISNLVSAMSKGVSSDTLVKRLSELEVVKTNLKTELKKLKGKTPNSVTENDIKNTLNRFKKVSLLPIEQQIMIVNLFIDRVDMSKTELHIHAVY